MRIEFLNIPVDALSMEETVSVIDKAIQNGSHINHVAINAAKIVSMQKNPRLYESVVSCDLISADGQSIVWASRLLGKRIPERVSGADLMQKLVRLAYEKKYKCFFLGAKEDIVKKVTEMYSKEYGSEIIAGYRNGYFLAEEEQSIAEQIAGSGTQLLFVAITSPKKENFLHDYRDMLRNVNFTMGVGGTFDVISGLTKRAPLWVQKIGMEWFFRLMQEPRRMWKRYLIGNAKFVWLVFLEMITPGKYWSARR
jgi:N-acetylglucosaminyldiphosphoundecaprenol N-acetyl-beta-D-mannosaminyltransferase